MILNKVVIMLLKLYKAGISPIMKNLFGSGCRFNPTCSTYSIEVIEKFGIKKGFKLSLKRLSKCHPFSKSVIEPIPN